MKGSEVQGHPQVDSELKSSLGYIRPQLKIFFKMLKKKKKNGHHLTWVLCFLEGRQAACPLLLLHGFTPCEGEETHCRMVRGQISHSPIWVGINHSGSFWAGVFFGIQSVINYTLSV